MDHAYYSQLWLDARTDLQKLISHDETIKNRKPMEDRDEAENEILHLYFRYRNIVQRLTFCFNEIVQPQIREFIQRELDYAIVRMLEIRQEMVEFTASDYPWPIDPLLDLKFTVDDMDLSAPTYNYGIRLTEIDRRKKLFQASPKKYQSDAVSADTTFYSEMGDSEDSLLGMYGGEEEGEDEEAEEEEEEKEEYEVMKSRVGDKEAPEIDMQEAEHNTFNDAVLLIQSNERARVGRRNFKNVIRQLMLRDKLGSQQINLKKLNQKERIQAAVIIQKTWRGFATRRKLGKIDRKIQELIGMAIPSGGTRNIIQRYNQVFVAKAKMQAEAALKLKEIIESEEKRIWETRGPTLIEDIRDEIRVWFFEWFEKMGFFDYIPPTECGGSVLITTGQSRTTDEYFANLQEAKSKKGKKDEKTPEEKEEKEEKEESNAEEGWKMKESRVMMLMTELDKEFRSKWNSQMKKILDPTGALIYSFIYEDIGHKLQLEMREIADESMRIELENFNAALKLDHEGREFTLPEPQKCEAVVEKENPGTELLPNVSEDELVMELMRANVIEEVPECRLSEWPGTPTYVYRRDGEIRLGDLKHAVMDYCVLPLGSKAVHELAPFNRSVCICGPPGAGQIFIARAICNELKATVFNLTPEKHKGRYKSQSSQDRLVQGIIKLARAFPPSVVLVEGNLAWFKQVPSKYRRLDPKRFSPIYKRIVSLIEPGDQVLFLTAATQPYLADKSFVKIHDKFIIVPVVDSGTTYTAYKNSLMRHHAIPRNFNASSLARVIGGQTTLEFAENALAQCLHIRRRMSFKRNPLQPVEILEALFTNPERPSMKDLALFDKFRFKLPQEKRRLELLQEIMNSK